jgi:GNAT superfamily N-acetyltransferase
MNWPLELADNPNTYTPLRPGDERIVTDRYVLFLSGGAGGSVAQRFRFEADELDEVRLELHALMRERGRAALAWEIGTYALPGDLVERLLALGLEDDGLQVGMVLTEPPSGPAPEGVEVRRVASAEEDFEAERIAAIAFGGPVPTAPRPFEPGPDNATYLAYVDGAPIARASSAFGPHGVTLFGGATLPEARGHGAYRALVAARWEDAVERGTPVLVTQAGPMSRPILGRLGFREVCEIRALNDRVA